MACNNSYGPVLSDSECASMEASYPRCAQLIQSCYDNQYHPRWYSILTTRNVWSCVPASLYCNVEDLSLHRLIGLERNDRPLPTNRPEVHLYPVLANTLAFMTFVKSVKMQVVSLVPFLTFREPLVSSLAAVSYRIVTQYLEAFRRI